MLLVSMGKRKIKGDCHLMCFICVFASDRRGKEEERAGEMKEGGGERGGSRQKREGEKKKEGRREGDNKEGRRGRKSPRSQVWLRGWGSPVLHVVSGPLHPQSETRGAQPPSPFSQQAQGDPDPSLRHPSGSQRKPEVWLPLSGWN